MPVLLKTIICLLLLYTLAISCDNVVSFESNKDNPVQQPLNPNGDSELAVLMRAMFDETHLLKQQIANGDSIQINLNHEAILTANATEPEKAATAEYKAFSKVYLQALDHFNSASGAQKVGLYENVVDNCMSCHKAMCPGPIVRIKKLL